MSETEWFQGRGVEEKHERAYIRRIVGWVLFSLFLLWAVYPKEATAQVAKKFELVGGAGTQDSLRIFEEPCANADVKKAMDKKKVPLKYRDKFKRSSLVWDGVEYDGCWIGIDGEVLNLDHKGDYLLPTIPLGSFKDKSV